jgi:hypothetical protein
MQREELSGSGGHNPTTLERPGEEKSREGRDAGGRRCGAGPAVDRTGTAVLFFTVHRFTVHHRLSWCSPCMVVNRITCCRECLYVVHLF